MARTAAFPDGGLFVQHAEQRYSHRHDILTPFDLVGASHWVVADNQVTHFIKATSSYP